MATATFTSGAIFGSALTASGVYIPAVIVSQMQLTNFHMLKAFLAASACSALVVDVAQRAGYAKFAIRKPAAYGWLGSYDANVVGGLLLGGGMSLTGACPGTVLVQIATGLRSGLWVCAGGMLGGIAFAKLGPYLRRGPSQLSQQPATAQQHHTVYGKLKITPETMLFIYESMCLLMIAASIILAPQATGSTFLPPVIGGILIGLGQAASVLLTRRTVGVSGAYGEFGGWFWRALQGSKAPAPSTDSMVFAAGVLAGAAALTKYVPATAGVGTHEVDKVSALVGGAAMIIGARMAGGCTSGHGISGMATFAVSSFVTVAAMFAGGIGMAMALQ